MKISKFSINIKHNAGASTLSKTLWSHLNSRNLLHNLYVFLSLRTAAGPKQCNFCLGPDEASCWENQETDLQCDTAPDSIGITHCATAVGKYRDDKSGNISDFFIRGCVDCASR